MGQNDIDVTTAPFRFLLFPNTAFVFGGTIIHDSSSQLLARRKLKRVNDRDDDDDKRCPRG